MRQPVTVSCLLAAGQVGALVIADGFDLGVAEHAADADGGEAVPLVTPLREINASKESLLLAVGPLQRGMQRCGSGARGASASDGGGAATAASGGAGTGRCRAAGRPAARRPVLSSRNSCLHKCHAAVRMVVVGW